MTDANLQFLNAWKQGVSLHPDLFNIEAKSV